VSKSEIFSRKSGYRNRFTQYTSITTSSTSFDATGLEDADAKGREKVMTLNIECMRVEQDYNVNETTDLYCKHKPVRNQQPRIWNKNLSSIAKPQVRSDRHGIRFTSKIYVSPRSRSRRRLQNRHQVFIHRPLYSIHDKCSYTADS